MKKSIFTRRRCLGLEVLLAAFFLQILVGACVNASDKPNTDKPNILWLTTEDIGPELGCYGDPDANTPNIDAFAKQSLRFKTAWSNYPVCAPARTTIITGRYASSMAAGNMRSDMPLPPDVVMFPALLRQAGYYCTNNSKEDYNVAKPDGVWDESGKKAHYRNRKQGQPFFAVFNHKGTHESKIRVRPHTAVTDPSSLTLPPFWPDLPEIREDLGQYYDNINRMDGWFQQKLDELNKSGQADNTIVFFYGDHGSGMPRYKRYAGDTGYRVAMIVHIPEKYQHLALDYQPGAVSNRLVSFVDLAPTVLSMAAIKPKPSMEGRAWFGPHAQSAEQFLYGFRERMDERIDLSHCLRDARFEYTVNYMPNLPAGQSLVFQEITPTTRKWYEAFKNGQTNAVESAFWLPRSAEEFYDMNVDPYCVNNLIDDPRWKDQVDRFRAAHRKKALASPDFSFIPESISNRPNSASTVPAAFEAAQTASLLATDPTSDARVLAMLQDNDPAVRYWATIGVGMRVKRWAETAAKEIDEASQTLVKNLADNELIVRVAAADVLVSTNIASDETRGKAIAQLMSLADMSQSNFLVAVAAVNVLDRNQNLLADSQIQSIAELPELDPARTRGTDYMQKLKTQFAR